MNSSWLSYLTKLSTQNEKKLEFWPQLWWATALVLVTNLLSWSWVSLARMSCGTGQLATEFQWSFHQNAQYRLPHAVVKEHASKGKTFCKHFKAQISTPKCGPFSVCYIKLRGFASSSAYGRASIALWRPAKAATVCCCQGLAGACLLFSWK